MSGLPSTLNETLSALLGEPVCRVTPISGGMINQAARVDTAHCSVFVKWRSEAPAGFFAAEAAGLSRLRMAGALRVPDVIAVDDSHAPPFLLLEYLSSSAPVESQTFTRRFGESLARLHLENPSADGCFGWEADNFIGALPQPNARRTDWVEFYHDCRLLPQIEIARRLGRLRADREEQLMALLERLPKVLAHWTPQPVLLHGDLWSGNFLCVENEPVVVDPAVYYGEREVEIAYVEMFGGFPEGFVAAYRANFPLDSGYEYRRALHQLYPYLVHLNIFGETYGPDVDRICRTYQDL